MAHSDIALYILRVGINYNAVGRVIYDNAWVYLLV